MNPFKHIDLAFELLIALLCFTSLARAADAPAKPDEDPKRWEKEVAAYEALDRDKQPPPGGVLFVGSSSIRLWKLDDSFKDLPVPALNRGIGGSHISDIV